MSDVRVFTTDDAEQVAAMVAYSEAFRGFRAALDAFAAEVDPDGNAREVMALDDPRTGPYAIGLKPDDDDETHPPKGWHVTTWGGHAVLRPYRRSNAGKELAARIEALRVKKPGIVGMPGTIVIGHRFYEPGYGIIDGRLYCKWHGSVTDDDLLSGRWGKPADLTVWREVPLSEFYAAAEKVGAA